MATDLRSENSGLVLAGRFELRRRLGVGGSGVVYEAIDTESRGRVALKTLQRMDPDALVRFKEEFRALQDIEHRNLVHLGELTCADGLWFLTMELVEGCDFLDYVRPKGEHPDGIRTLNEERLRRCLAQLVDALLVVHESGRVHCDVKPSNIRVDPTGRLVLLDFGLVTFVSQSKRELSLDAAVGTPAYMAPEQCRSEAPTPAVDWYALGALTYEALTGTLPFTSQAPKIFWDKQHVTPRDPRELARDIPAELADVCMQLLSFSPADRPSGESLLTLFDEQGAEALARRTRLPTDTPPFVGRKAQQARLQEQLRKTRQGRPTFVYLSGESGIGKTELAKHFGEFASKAEGALVLRSRCYERETVPYKAFDGAVDDLARHLGKLDSRRCRSLLPTNAKLLVQLFPVLSHVEALNDLPQGPLPQDPQVLRSHAFAALREILARLSLAQPLLIIIDDLQWADADSLALLDELLNEDDAPPCMVLATGRPLAQLSEELRAALAPSLGADFSFELPLTGLEHAEAEQLIRKLVQGEHDPTMYQRIVRETKGHPLFLCELVRHAESGHAHAATRHLDEALRNRVEELEPQTRAVLETLAIASMPTAQATLAQALRIEPLELGRKLAQLRAVHLVRSEDRLRSECYHDRVRRVVLEMLPPAVKKQRHRALASALSALDHADAESTAYQWTCAGDPVRAARYSAQAAEEADHALAFRRAARLYEEALAHPEAFEPDRIHGLRLALARALSCAGFAERSAEVCLAASKSRHGEEARALRRRATQLMLRSGRVLEGLELADAVLAEVGVSRPKSPSSAVFRLAWERTRLAVRGLEVKPRKESAESKELLELLWAVAPSLAFVDLLGGSALQSQYARMALSSGDVQHVVRSLTVEALVGSTTDKPPQSRVTSILQQVRAIADASDLPYLKALVWMSHGYSHWVSFRLVEAIASLVQAERLLRESCVDVAWELTNARAGLLNALWNAGRVAQQDELARYWRRDARERGDRYAATQLICIGLGYQPSLRVDDPDAADSTLDEALVGWPTDFQLPHWSQFIGRMLVALYRGTGGSHAFLRATMPRLKRSQLLNVPYLAFLTHSDAAWACLDEAMRNEGATRRSLLQEALHFRGKLLKTRWPLAAELSDQIQAQVLLLEGNDTEATALLRRAESALRTNQSVYQYSTGYLLGRMLGGDEGAALCERAMIWARAEQIAVPVRWLSMFAPTIRKTV
jgi:serine/threonine protein kinase